MISSLRLARSSVGSRRHLPFGCQGICSWTSGRNNRWRRRLAARRPGLGFRRLNARAGGGVCGPPRLPHPAAPVEGPQRLCGGPTAGLLHEERLAATRRGASRGAQAARAATAHDADADAGPRGQLRGQLEAAAQPRPRREESRGTRRGRAACYEYSNDDDDDRDANVASAVIRGSGTITDADSDAAAAVDCAAAISARPSRPLAAAGFRMH